VTQQSDAYTRTDPSWGGEGNTGPMSESDVYDCLITELLGQTSRVTLLTLPHTHTHPFNGPLSKTTQVSQYQKPIWILLKHETVSGSGISWATVTTIVSALSELTGGQIFAGWQSEVNDWDVSTDRLVHVISSYCAIHQITLLCSLGIHGFVSCHRFRLTLRCSIITPLLLTRKAGYN